jgi:hypothetical protein
MNRFSWFKRQRSVSSNVSRNCAIHFEVHTLFGKYLFVARLCLGSLSFSATFFCISRYLLTFYDHTQA